MFACLRKFGFGDEFIQWIKLRYTDIHSCVTSNGFSSNWFNLLRGIRQGCALSCYLFIICVEIMASMIRKNRDIMGSQIDKYEDKIKQFDVDCTYTLKTIESVKYLIDTNQTFSKISGLKLNLEKSLLVYLGPWRYKRDKIMNIKVSPGTFNMLGVNIGVIK